MWLWTFRQRSLTFVDDHISFGDPVLSASTFIVRLWCICPALAGIDRK
jgi:hypothetical protein